MSKIRQNYWMYFLQTVEFLKWFEAIDPPKPLAPKVYEITPYHTWQLSGVLRFKKCVRSLTMGNPKHGMEKPRSSMSGSKYLETGITMLLAADSLNNE